MCIRMHEERRENKIGKFMCTRRETPERDWQTLCTRGRGVQRRRSSTGEWSAGEDENTVLQFPETIKIRKMQGTEWRGEEIEGRGWASRRPRRGGRLAPPTAAGRLRTRQQPLPSRPQGEKPPKMSQFSLRTLRHIYGEVRFGRLFAHFKNPGGKL